MIKKKKDSWYLYIYAIWLGLWFPLHTILSALGSFAFTTIYLALNGALHPQLKKLQKSHNKISHHIGMHLEHLMYVRIHLEFAIRVIRVVWSSPSSSVWHTFPKHMSMKRDIIWICGTQAANSGWIRMYIRCCFKRANRM